MQVDQVQQAVQALYGAAGTSPEQQRAANTFLAEFADTQVRANHTAAALCAHAAATAAIAAAAAAATAADGIPDAPV